MTSHELARQLLAGPDLPLQVLADVAGWNDIGAVEAQVRPSEETVLIIGRSVELDDDEERDD